MRTWIAYLMVFSIFFSVLDASAQSGRWDTALDQYEDICSRCIDLRQRSLSGEAVQTSSVTDLLSQLASLRSTLQKAAGQMTPSQRARFESIRLRYSEAFGASSGMTASAFRSSIAPPSTLPALTLSPAAVTDACRPTFPDRQLSGGAPKALPVVADRPSVRFGVIAFGSMLPLQPGLMARLDLGAMGVYVKGTKAFIPQGDYECRSDGTTDKGLLWTTGRERLGVSSISAGATFGISALRVYAGAGYGRRTVLWEDASGRWARVSDLSSPGLSADAGLLFDLGHLSLMAGVSSISFRTLGCDVGLGFIF